MNLTKKILALAFIAASVTFAVCSHTTDSDIDQRCNSNKTSPGYFRCYSKLTQEQMAELESKNGIIGDRYRWPGGIMYYAYDKSVSPENITIIAQGMKLITDKTCIKFVPRTIQRNYVLIQTNVPNSGCFSKVGMIGGKQILNLDLDGCITVPTAAHELIHAIGFIHEHQRNDRDKYITVMYDNIQSIYKIEFNLTLLDTTTFGVRYNVRSLMHYEACSPIAIDRNKPIMVSRNPSDPIPAFQNEQLDLTDTDGENINRMYKNQCRFQSVETFNFGF